MSTLARIVTTCQNYQGHSTVEGNREAMLALFDRALKHQPDLVCFPEAFTGVGVAQEEQRAEPVPGPTTEAFAQRARAHRCYVICPLRTARDGRQWNSAVVIDRSGDILGLYDKVHPVTTSPDYTVFEDGLFPGGDPPVFDLDFGRIGIQICFDIGFPENWQTLAAKGAKLIVWSSAYDGGFPLQVYAWLHHVWVVTSTRTQHSRIVDPCGEILAETKPSERLVVRTINLDTIVSHLDWNMSIPGKIKAKYGDRVDVRQWIPGTSHFIVEPRDPAIKTADLQKEFGFEPTTLYHERHRRCYARLRKGKQPEPQQALHGKRPQWGME